MREWHDPSVLEAASWRLASELVRRHPHRMQLLRTHPGGGQYDCLTIVKPEFDGSTIELNRSGRIHVHARFDDERVEWEPVEWDDYLRADPRSFLLRLEAAAGLQAPAHVPPATNVTLTLRVLAAIAATAVKSVQRIEIASGYIDSPGYHGGPNPVLDEFATVPGSLSDARPTDLFGQPGYRFWVIQRNDGPVAVIEQSSALAWTRRADRGHLDLMATYATGGRRVEIVALELLRSIDAP